MRGKVLKAILYVGALLGLAPAADVPLATFDVIAPSTTRQWIFKKDPVMGGSSDGTFVIQNGIGVIGGTVGRMPILRWPSFIKAETTDLSKPFPDVAKCHAITLELRSDVSYLGYHFSFGDHRPVFYKPTYGFKARFDAPVGAFANVTIPFHNFTSSWDDETGDPVRTCEDDPNSCPDQGTLKNMKTMCFWAQGVTGKVHLEIKKISASQCEEIPRSAAALHVVRTLSLFV